MGDAGEAGIREHRKIIFSIWPHALAQCTQEVGVGPGTDAGVAIWRDVRTVKCAERRGERPTTRERRAAGHGVAGKAAAGAHQVFAAGGPRATASDLKVRSASQPIVVFAHIPVWTVYEQWG